MKKNKRIYFIVILIAILIILAITEFRPVLRGSVDDITRVTIMSGTTGDIVEVPEDQIETLAKLCKSTWVARVFLPSHGGWRYSITFYRGEKETKVTFVSDKLCTIGRSDFTLITDSWNEIQDIIDNIQ